MHPSEPPQTLGRPRERGGRGKNWVNWQSSGQSGASERDMCGSVDLMVLGGATPGEIVILFYVGTATGLVVGVLKSVLKLVRKLARRGAVNPGGTVRRLGRHWPGGVPGGMKPMVKPVLKPVFPNAYRPQAGF